jgi:hypothetical protein
MRELFSNQHLTAVEYARRACRRLASERGQGTVEYVGLILLVSLLMVGMVAAMKGFNRSFIKGCAARCRAEQQRAAGAISTIARRRKRPVPSGPAELWRHSRARSPAASGPEKR